MKQASVSSDQEMSRRIAATVYDQRRRITQNPDLDATTKLVGLMVLIRSVHERPVEFSEDGRGLSLLVGIKDLANELSLPESAIRDALQTLDDRNILGSSS